MSNHHLLMLHHHFQQILNSDSVVETDDAVSALVDFINDIIIVNDQDQDSKQQQQIAMDILTDLLGFVSSPSLDQMLLDALSFELPKLLVKFCALSVTFSHIAESIMDRLISTCNPRDILAVICEVLHSPAEMFKEPAYFTPLFSGLSKAFISLQRRHFEHIKEALPAVLNVLQAVSFELDDGNMDSFVVLIGRAICIATSIRTVCQKLEGRQKEQTRTLLSLFVLQIMAFVSSNLVDTHLNIPVMSKLSQFLSFCNLSYLGLVTGGDLEACTVILKEENEDCMGCFSLVKQGAFIAVIWGINSDEVARAADEDLAVVKDNLRNSQNKRWQTVGMLKYVLSSIDQPWQLKEHAIDFILCIMEGNICQKCSNEYANRLFDMPSLYSSVQAIEMVIMYAPDAVFRKKAFAALKMVLADIPTHQRFDILMALITNSNNTSMVAILIDIVKAEMFMESSKKVLPRNDEVNQVCPSSPFWSKDVLELIEFVLKPPKGGPPSLPEQSDSVLSALNLYRFLLITESTGKTNYTGVLAENTLQKICAHWLLPLRILVSKVMTENQEEYIAVEDTCALNPVRLVLERCIELTEDRLQHTT